MDIFEYFIIGSQLPKYTSQLKGADRKHKQDREKLLKRPNYEQEKYQPSCECTILSEVSVHAVQGFK